MGKIKDILAERHIGSQGMYADHARLELMENVHFHWRDLRIVMAPEDLENLKELVNSAHAKWEEQGKPKECDWFNVLSEVNLKDEGYHNTRLGVEEEEDGSIHTHYRDLRIHQQPADFLILAQKLWLASLQYNKDHAVKVSLDDLAYHEIVDTYVSWLEKRNEEILQTGVEEGYYVESYETKELLDIKYDETHSGHEVKRPNGLPDWFPSSIETDKDKNYLVELCISMLTYGYARGPYAYQYIRVYRQEDGSLYCKDSHRLACLLFLGYQKVKAVVVDSEAGWRE